MPVSVILDTGASVSLPDVGYLEAALAVCKASELNGRIIRGGVQIGTVRRTPGGGWLADHGGEAWTAY